MPYLKLVCDTEMLAHNFSAGTNWQQYDSFKELLIAFYDLKPVSKSLRITPESTTDLIHHIIYICN